MMLVTVFGTGTSVFLVRLVGLAGSPCAFGITITGSITETSSTVVVLVRKSHKQISPSLPPVASSASLVGSQHVVFTVLVCPWRTCVVTFLSIEVMREEWSPEHVTMWASILSHLTSNIPFSCGWKVTRSGSAKVVSRVMVRIQKSYTNQDPMVFVS